MSNKTNIIAFRIKY